jgi:class 3 adenylate cyclase
MIQRVLCPQLVGRSEQLASLEDALLSASRGEGGTVLLAGEAGQGKTRLATELAARARKLGFAVLWGSCTEAELSLPYLPFAEAIGNYLAARGPAAVAAALGPLVDELVKIFPQLGELHRPAMPDGDPAQARLRLFEAIVSLLAVPAHEQGLLLVVEDVHWADGPSRELLEHLARRAPSLRLLALVSYRSDEVGRRHPLAPALQAWRRSGLAVMVPVGPLSADGVGRMIRAIFDTGEVSDEFRDLMHRRCEGNPFVLEEMLKEAIERGDIYRADGRWERKPIADLGIPETVQDTILRRLDRLIQGHQSVLQAAAIVGRVFTYRTLATVARTEAATVEAALDAAVVHQLIEEGPQSAGEAAYRWRHALTQEAIEAAMLVPRRQALHGLAADALAADPRARTVDLAHHLFSAGRFEAAVPVCLRAAEEAEAATAYSAAASLYEKALPHVGDARGNAMIVGRIGRAWSFDGEFQRAERWLDHAVRELERLGAELEAARFRTELGRCHWVGSEPELSLQDYEAARRVLERAGPSADLAVTHLRIGAAALFAVDARRCEEEARRAAAIATAAGADFERVWAESFVAAGLVLGGRVGEGLDLSERCYQEALARGYGHIAENVTYNDAWCRLHLMLGGLEERVRRLSALPTKGSAAQSEQSFRAHARRIAGDLEGALEAAAASVVMAQRIQHPKFERRSRIEVAEVLVELGRTQEAAESLPDRSTLADLQDFVYDARARLRVLLDLGRGDAAATYAREILAHAGELSGFRETLALAAEAFCAAGDLDRAQALVAEGEAAATPAGMGFLDLARGRLALARGEPEAAADLLARAAAAARGAGHRIDQLQADVLLGEALARSGRRAEAKEVLGRAVRDTRRIGAARLLGEAVARMKASDLPLPPEAEEPPVDGREEPVPVGERMVTTMFADVRGYTAMAADVPPEELASRMTSLYRWAKAEVEHGGGLVDKFAGDAVMATFNVSGDRVGHVGDALQAAIGLRDRARLVDLDLGIGIAVGSAVVGNLVPGANLSVLGPSTNLGARLQAAAGASEILLSEEAHRRAARWLSERGIEAEREELLLKGFREAQVVYRIPGSRPVLAAP